MATSERPAFGTSPPSAAEPSVPSRIGQRFHVLERLGRGGMAIVYRVCDQNRTRALALKQLTLGGSAHDRALRRQFEREFFVLSQLAHPGVVQVHDFGVDPAGPFYTMELLDAGDLSAGAPWPYQQACQRMMQICSALALLHSRGLVHRDISPRNVRSAEAGAAKLIDFGAITEFGRCAQVVGTPGFVAPEVVHRLALDARTDLFSLGATLYYALTGCPPFAARSLAELAAAWGDEPTPPSARVPGIPSALDALVLSMLRTDPDRRPGSAFEVMQRLAASAGVVLPESDVIARASLHSPELIGREGLQRQLRHCLRRSMSADGHAVLLQGAAGLGRTRLLDATVTEAQIAGATVLRVSARAAGTAPFASARQLAARLLELLPDTAVACARAAELTDTLFVPPEAGDSAGSTSARLRAFDVGADNAVPLQAALKQWLGRVCQTQPLVIALDDVDHIDDASLALVIALVHGASELRLLLVCTLHEPIDSSARPALGVLSAHCTRLTLAPWSAEETRALFASVFCAAPHAALVSDRVHKLAVGNPRESLALAQHMLDRQLIRFTDGNWCLPAELAISDLPASAQDALHMRLAALPVLPRRLASAQALALEPAWRRNSYRELAADSSIAEVDMALALLLKQRVICDSEGTYTLSHPAVQQCLVASLSAAERQRHERALAALCAAQRSHWLREVHHLQHADEHEAALDRLGLSLSAAHVNTSALRVESGLDAKTIAQTLERAHTASLARHRQPREAEELARLLVEASISIDSHLYFRYAPRWLRQLVRDSGLHDYRASDPQLEPGQRLQIALQTAVARYANSPVSERVYKVDEAIKLLAQYVVISLAIYARTQEISVLAELPELLAPFSSLSPILHALWQMAIGTCEWHVGRAEHFRARMIEVHARLCGISGRDFPYVEEIRAGVARAVTFSELLLGYQSAARWIDLMKESLLLGVSAHQLRRALCMFDGDAAGAERHRVEAELLAVQSLARDIFDSPVQLELQVQMHVGNLAGVKQAADRISQLARDWSGWVPLDEYAQGCFQRMRGDLPAAKAAFERTMASCDPEQREPAPQLGVWLDGAAGYVQVLAELGELTQARDFGQQALVRCDALGIMACGPALVRALALVEAKLGDYPAAAERLDRLIAERAHVRPSMLALDLEARARVAIWAKDTSAASHFARLATQESAASGGAANLAKRARLLDEAERAGVELSVPPSEFESQVLHKQRPNVVVVPANHAHGELARYPTPEARASRVLGLLMEAAQANAGVLYLAQHDRLTRVDPQNAKPDAALDAFAERYLQRWLTEPTLTTVFTELQEAQDPPWVRWTDRNAKVHAIALLLPGPETVCVGVVALCGVSSHATSPVYRASSTALAQQLLALGDVQPKTKR